MNNNSRLLFTMTPSPLASNSLLSTPIKLDVIKFAAAALISEFFAALLNNSPASFAPAPKPSNRAVSYTHLRAHET